MIRQYAFPAFLYTIAFILMFLFVCGTVFIPASGEWGSRDSVLAWIATLLCLVLSLFSINIAVNL